MDDRETVLDCSEIRGLLPAFLLLLIHEHPSHRYGLIERLLCLRVTGVGHGQVYRVLGANLSPTPGWRDSLASAVC